MKAPVSLFRIVASFKKYLIRGRSALISQPRLPGACARSPTGRPRVAVAGLSHRRGGRGSRGTRGAPSSRISEAEGERKGHFQSQRRAKTWERPTGQGSVERDGGLACAEAGHSGPARRGSPPGRRTCGVTRSRAGSRQVSGTGASLPGGSTLRVRSSSLYVSLSRGNLPFNVHKRCWDDRFISGLGEAPGRAAGTAGVSLTLRAGATVGRGPQRKGQSCGAAPAPRPAPQLAGVVTQLPQLARQAPPPLTGRPGSPEGSLPSGGVGGLESRQRSDAIKSSGAAALLVGVLVWKWVTTC